MELLQTYNDLYLVYRDINGQARFFADEQHVKADTVCRGLGIEI